MRKNISILFILLASTLFSQNLDEITKTSDGFFWTSKYHNDLNYLTKNWDEALPSNLKKEIAWRICRSMIMVTNEQERLKKKNKTELMSDFQKAMRWAEKANGLDYSDPTPYYWIGAALGRWAETKGILEAAGQREEMRNYIRKGSQKDNQQSDLWFLSGQLFFKLPGFLGGSKSRAVSVDRFSCATYKAGGRYFKNGPDINTYYYVELARHLGGRNWNASSRMSNLPKIKKNYTSSNSAYEKASYFEGSMNFSKIPLYSKNPLSMMSDRQEAVAISQWALNWLKKQPKSFYINDHIREFQTFIRNWK